jgi:hypothetical protein
MSLGLHPQLDSQAVQLNQVIHAYIGQYRNYKQNVSSQMQWNAEYAETNSEHYSNKMSRF